MTTAHDDTARTWRDLADQLTPDQVAELEYCESHQVPPGLCTPRNQLTVARGMSRHNIIQRVLGDITPPPEAVEVYDWETWSEMGYGRMYTVWDRTLDDDYRVEIVGVQFDDGHTERSIFTTVPDEKMTAGHARQLAGLLIEAADELDRRRPA